MKRATKIFFIFATISVFSLTANLFLHKAKAEENTSSEPLSCNQEIPIGEIIEETVGFMGGVRSDAIGLQSLLKQEISASQELILSVQSCDIGNCSPSCDLKSYSVSDGQGGAQVFSYCEANNCNGQICPESKISSDFAKVKSIYEEIEKAQESAEKAITKKDFSFSIKPYVNPLLPFPVGLYPEITNKTKSEAIQAKLDASRGLFDSCFSTPQEWQEVLEGKKIGKVLLSCRESLDFAKDDLSQECKDSCSNDPKGEKCTECLGCKSAGNFFCCTTK